MTVLVDDAQLLRMAVEPPTDAARLLQRSTTYGPLVLALALVPAGLIAASSALPGDSSRWALRALSVEQAQQLSEWLQPGLEDADLGLAAAPPLQSWLSALVLRGFPPGLVLPTVLVSMIAVAFVVLGVWYWLREIVDERTALIAATLLAFHPQVLPWSGRASPEALTTLLLLITGWGLWGHLEQRQTWLSVRMLAGGLAWGLALLAGGPTAIAFVLVLLLWGVWTEFVPLDRGQSWPSRAPALRAVILLVLTGVGLGAWWTAMIVADGGLEAGLRWLTLEDTGGPARDLTMRSPASQRDVVDWLQRSAFLGGWWLIGLLQAARSALGGKSAIPTPWARWLLVWTFIGTLLRWFATGPESSRLAIALWEAFLVIPATVLAAQGLDRVLRRKTSSSELWLALVLTVGGVAWWFTGRLAAGALIGGVFGLLLLASAPLAVGLRRSAYAWSEAEIRWWVIVAALVTVTGHSLQGWVRSLPDAREARFLTDVRRHLLKASPINTTSIVAAAGDEVAVISYLLRSLWPQSEHLRSSYWDPRLTTVIVGEASRPRSRIVLVEWHRRELRLRADVGTGWSIRPLIDPQPYHDRRFAAHLIAPVENRQTASTP